MGDLLLAVAAGETEEQQQLRAAEQAPIYKETMACAYFCAFCASSATMSRAPALRPRLRVSGAA
jgi:hypothetical protein